jgi:hypothetical protein
MSIKGTQLEFCYNCPGLYVLFPLKVCLSFWLEKLIGTKALILSTTNIYFLDVGGMWFFFSFGGGSGWKKVKQ